MTTFKNFLILSLLFLFSGQLFATHIVGGGITYEYVSNVGGNKLYRFTMKVYRDCINGQVPFDSPASIAIYNGSYQNNDFFDSFEVFLDDVKEITVNEPDCIDNLPSICLEEATYTWESILPQSAESYFVVYQRCCRTNAIANIFFPSETGATYHVEITPLAQQLGNSSPVFNFFPPVVICNNYPLEVNYSATDAEGDLLVYSFCAPFAGGGLNGNDCFSAQPTPPCAPPFVELSFIEPQYTAAQPLAGNPVVQINANTGLISGTPHMNGQFVVGVCVQEFRNGQLLSVTRRDFQFNVADCAPQVTALVQHDEVTSPQHYVIKRCNGTKSLTIVNQSTLLANIVDFKWTFDLNNGNFITNTTDFNLPITFPDFGTYNGTLVLNQGQDCGDTAYIQVQLYPVATLDLGPDFTLCKDSTIQFNAGTGFASYQWQDGSVSQTFSASASGVYHVLAIDHCGNLLRDSVNVVITPIPDIVLSDVIICQGGSVTVNVPGFDSYAWTPAAGLSCTDCATVTAQPSVSSVYSLTATNVSGCTAQGDFQVEVLPTPMSTQVITFYQGQSVTLGGQTYTEADTVTLTVISTTGGCDSLNTYILQLIPTDLSIQCPANLTVALPATDNSIVVNYPDPTVTTDCPGTPSAIQLLQGLGSGSAFPAGVNTVCYAASNNCDDIDTCCFTVTVTNLAIQCPANLTVALPNDATTVAVNYDLPTATTDCPDTQISIQLLEGQPVGADFQGGVNNICFMATNTCGNQDSCCFTVTVTSLAIECPANLTVALPNNATTIPVNYALPTAVSDCPDTQLSIQLLQGLPSGGDFAAGVNNVCFEATNTCGNRDSCCFAVTVTTLGIQCPANVTVALPNNAAGVVVNYAAPTTTTNCPDPAVNVNLLQGQASGGMFPAGVTSVCYGATNTCGNTNSCCFTVTATTLDIQCPPAQTVTLPVAGTSVAVNYSAPTTTSTCPDPVVTVNLIQGQLSGGAFPLGVNKVCYEGVNSCGNRDTCCFNITVLDSPKPCDIKNIGCMRFELLDIRLDSIVQRRYRIRATNFCATEVDYIAIQLPIGVIAVTPKEGSIYTAPNTGNQYLIRNPNASPFYSIRYRSVATGLNNGQSDVLEYKLPQQSQPDYIHIGARLRNGEFYPAHLNTFYCPVQPWAGSKEAAGTRDDEFDTENVDFEALAFEETNPELSVRPNPTAGLVLVDLSQWLDQSVKLQVLNAQGQVVLDRSYDVDGEWLELNLDASLSNGLYYLVLQPAGGKTATARFVLQH